MSTTEWSSGRYVLAAAVGGFCGGLAAVLATKELPRLLSHMKTHMHEICDEKCGCGRGDEQDVGKTSEPSCN